LSQSIREQELARVFAAVLHANTQLSSQATAGVGHNRGPPEAEPALYTIEGFCKSHNVSRSLLYQLLRDGIGPRTIKLGRTVRISREAEIAWRAERQAASNQAA